MSIGTYEPQAFELAVVNEVDYEHDRDCPHCSHVGFARHLMSINDVSAFIQGAVRLCKRCDLPFLVMAFPAIPNERPIYLDWTVNQDSSNDCGNPWEL